MFSGCWVVGREVIMWVVRLVGFFRDVMFFLCCLMLVSWLVMVVWMVASSLWWNCCAVVFS